MRITGGDYVRFCIANDFFTNGDTYQYDTVIKMASEGRNVHDIAVCTWICSSVEVRKKYTINKIESMLKEF